jgi:hypothetical protein
MTDFADVRIFFCTTPTKMSHSFDALMGRAQEIFDQDPTAGHLFQFLNRIEAGASPGRRKQALSP